MVKHPIREKHAHQENDTHVGTVDLRDRIAGTGVRATECVVDGLEEERERRRGTTGTRGKEL